MSPKDFSGILTRGGTILGTSRHAVQVPRRARGRRRRQGRRHEADLPQDSISTAWFALGGNGSLKTANRLSQEGLNVIGLPKTIDNDTWGTDMTFGFTSAVEVATQCIDNIHTTASSHGRVFVIEIMGHKVG